MEEKIIIDGFDVSECPHINAYNPDRPKCQQGMGVGGCGSDCKGRCRYIEKLKIEQIKQENKELKQTIKDLTQSLDDCNVQRTKLYKKLDFERQKREEFADKSIKYEFALEEIREMLPEQIDITELICIYKTLYNKVNEAIGE